MWLLGGLETKNVTNSIFRWWFEIDFLFAYSWYQKIYNTEYGYLTSMPFICFWFIVNSMIPSAVFQISFMFYVVIRVSIKDNYESRKMTNYHIFINWCIHQFDVYFLKAVLHHFVLTYLILMFIWPLSFILRSHLNTIRFYNEFWIIICCLYGKISVLYLDSPVNFHLFQ